MNSHDNRLASGHGQRLTLLHQVGGKTVDTAFGKLLTTCFASVLISVARVFQLGPAREVFKDQLIRLAAHCLRGESMLCAYLCGLTRKERRDGPRSDKTTDLEGTTLQKQEQYHVIWRDDQRRKHHQAGELNNRIGGANDFQREVTAQVKIVEERN